MMQINTIKKKKNLKNFINSSRTKTKCYTSAVKKKKKGKICIPNFKNSPSTCFAAVLFLPPRLPLPLLTACHNLSYSPKQTNKKLYLKIKCNLK